MLQRDIKPPTGLLIHTLFILLITLVYLLPPFRFHPDGRRRGEIT